MATQVNVDSATKDMPGKVESTRLSVPVKTPVINQISDVVYEQVPMRGYPNVAMKMDILQPKSAAKLPAIVYVTGGGFINANRTMASSSECTWPKRAMSSLPSSTVSHRRPASRNPWKM